ncbi:MAG: MFS transporter [Clostridia bacterium]|nr:MFS transporter [Clostridia bacterium]
MSTVRKPYESNPLSRLYEEAHLPQDIRRSLSLILLGNLFGNLHGIICGGGTTAMIGLANQLQAGDFAFGLLNSIPQAAALLQIPFSLLVNRTHKRKKYLLTYGLFSRMLWLLFGFIPVVVPQEPAGLQLWTLIFLLGISSCCSSAINVCWFPWLSDLAPISIRGRWFSIRDSVVAACNLLFGLLVARLLDTLPIESRYIIIFIIGGTVGVLDMVCFGFCKEVYSTPPRRLHFGGIMKDILRNRPFLRLTVMWTAWCFCSNMCGPYLARYSVNEMGLSFTQMMVFGTAAASIATILVISRWGKALDHFGCRSVMLTAGWAAAVTDAFYLFSTPGNVIPVLLRNFAGAMFWSGTNLAANSMQLSASPDEAKPSYIAVFACVTSLAGTTLGALAGGLLLEGWQKAGWFTGSFDRFKALILLAVLLRLCVAIFLVPPLQNDREGTPRQLLRSVLNGLAHFNLFRRF